MKTRRGCLVWAFVVTAAAVCIVLLSATPILKAMGEYLVVADPVGPCDAIVVISGSDGDRTVEGVRLFNQGIADRIIFSGNPVFMDVTYPRLMKQYAMKNGVPEQSIDTVEDSISTLQDAQKTLGLVREMGARRIVLVTSTYHARRAAKTFRSVYPDDIEILVHPVESEWFHSDWWWKNRRSINIVFNEYVKFFYDRFAIGAEDG